MCIFAMCIEWWLWAFEKKKKQRMESEFSIIIFFRLCQAEFNARLHFKKYI